MYYYVPASRHLPKDMYIKVEEVWKFFDSRFYFGIHFHGLMTILNDQVVMASKADELEVSYTTC